jgi:hypothetical protein
MNRHGVGYDYIRSDADQRTMRLDVRCQVKSVTHSLYPPSSLSLFTFIHTSPVYTLV